VKLFLARQESGLIAADTYPKSSFAERLAVVNQSHPPQLETEVQLAMGYGAVTLSSVRHGLLRRLNRSLPPSFTANPMVAYLHRLRTRMEKTGRHNGQTLNICVRRLRTQYTRWRWICTICRAVTALPCLASTCRSAKGVVQDLVRCIRAIRNPYPLAQRRSRHQRPWRGRSVFPPSGVRKIMATEPSQCATSVLASGSPKLASLLSSSTVTEVLMNLRLTSSITSGSENRPVLST
jgi:hypothetical protein